MLRSSAAAMGSAILLFSHVVCTRRPAKKMAAAIRLPLQACFLGEASSYCCFKVFSQSSCLLLCSTCFCHCYAMCKSAASGKIFVVTSYASRCCPAAPPPPFSTGCLPPDHVVNCSGTSGSYNPPQPLRCRLQENL